MFLMPLLAFSQIELLGSLTTGNSGTDIWEYIDPNNGKVFAIAGGNGMSVVEVTDPANPVQVAHLPSVPGFDVKVWQHYVYCATGGSGTASIVDINDPYNPQVVGTFPSAHNFHIDANGTLFASYPALRIYDLNFDPTAPTFITEVGGEGHDVTVRGNLMIDCHGYSGTNLYDISDLNNPVLLSSITDPTITYHHQGDVSSDGNYLYICDELSNHPQADITVWDISDISNPVRVSEYADASATTHNLYVIGNYAYASYYTAGLRVFDLNDPSQLVVADTYDTNGSTGEGFAGAFGVYPSPVTGNIYINDDSGIYVFGFSGLGTTSFDLGDKINLFPNPASENVTIQLENSTITSVEVYSMIGQQVMDLQELNVSEAYNLNVSNLQPGLYLVHVNDSFVQKLVVK